MLKLKTVFVSALALTLLALPAKADFDTSENNWQVKSGRFDFALRTYINKDYVHGQIGVKVYKNLKVSYRYAEIDVDNGADISEHRIRAENQVNILSWLYITPRVEYRIFGNDGDNHWRLRPEIGVHHTIDKFYVYAHFSPMWSFGLEEGNKTFTRTKTKVGVDYMITENVSVGPFYQHDTDGNWNTSNQFIGTNVKIRL